MRQIDIVSLNRGDGRMQDIDKSKLARNIKRLGHLNIPGGGQVVVYVDGQHDVATVGADSDALRGGRRELGQRPVLDTQPQCRRRRAARAGDWTARPAEPPSQDLRRRKSGAVLRLAMPLYRMRSPRCGGPPRDGSNSGAVSSYALPLDGRWSWCCFFPLAAKVGPHRIGSVIESFERCCRAVAADGMAKLGRAQACRPVAVH